MNRLQILASQWAARAFGTAHVTNSKIRALRLLEEAIELAQSEGIPRHLVDHSTEVVYSRPPGEANQEIGGVLLTAAVYCTCNYINIEDALFTELQRVLNKPIESFAARNAEKIALGLTV